MLWYPFAFFSQSSLYTIKVGHKVLLCFKFWETNHAPSLSWTARIYILLLSERCTYALTITNFMMRLTRCQAYVSLHLHLSFLASVFLIFVLLTSLSKHSTFTLNWAPLLQCLKFSCARLTVYSPPYLSILNMSWGQPVYSLCMICSTIFGYFLS